jgi:hypothetical protein
MDRYKLALLVLLLFLIPTSVFSGIVMMGGDGTSAVAPPSVLSDNFTDTNGTDLSAHTSDSGHTWIKHGSHASTILINNNRTYTGTSNWGLYYSSDVPSSADYTVKANIYIYTEADYGGSPAGRISTSADTYYFVLVQARSGGDYVGLYKTIDGVMTEIGSTTSFAMSSGNVYEIKLVMVGSSIKVFCGGTEKISVTDTSITGAGRPGVSLYGGGTSTAIHVDSIVRE